MKSPSIRLSYLVQKPDHGSKVVWIFYSGLKISISVGVLSAVGVLVIKAKHFLEVGHSANGVSSKSWAVPGLENLGNNCFLNVVLQALASCSSFRKYVREMEEEYGSLSDRGGQNIPHIASLASLVEELCTVHHKKTVLSPREVMLAMDHYIPNFNLTRQQDAEEAFSHLLSSLREEISEHCVPNKSYFADLPTLPNGRIIARKRSDEESEWQRWSRCYLRPFDGILGSILICQSCSFQISLEFQQFNSLHLSPPTSNNATIKAGSTLELCLKKFFAVERVEDYFCSNCWHAAAIQYLSTISEETDVQMLQHCSKNDSCRCNALSCLQKFPWSNRYNRFSRTFKQLSIARTPKILCIHLQRASYNMFGQSVKIMGHVSFPLILDLSSFISTGVGLKKMDVDMPPGPLMHSNKEALFLPYSMYRGMLLDPGIVSFKPSNVASNSHKTEITEEQASNVTVVKNGLCLNASEAAPALPDSRSLADDSVVRAQHHTYRLVSVVEHLGTSGSGHYKVYRKVTARLCEEEGVGLLESTMEQWFCISDSEVQGVGEKDVLNANASMLFYEKIG